MHKIKGDLAEGRMASNLADGRMESKEHKLGQRLNAVSAAGNPGTLPSMIKVSLLPALFRNSRESLLCLVPWSCPKQKIANSSGNPAPQ